MYIRRYYQLWKRSKIVYVWLNDQLPKGSFHDNIIHNYDATCFEFNFVRDALRLNGLNIQLVETRFRRWNRHAKITQDDLRIPRQRPAVTLYRFSSRFAKLDRRYRRPRRVCSCTRNKFYCNANLWILTQRGSCIINGPRVQLSAASQSIRLENNN